LTHIATRLYIADVRYTSRLAAGALGRDFEPRALLLFVCALLGLAEGAFLMENVLRFWTAASVVTGGVLAAVLVWRLLAPGAVVVLAGFGLVMPWVVIYVAFLVSLAGRRASEILFFSALVIPFAVAGLAVLGVIESQEAVIPLGCLRGRSYARLRDPRRGRPVALVERPAAASPLPCH